MYKTCGRADSCPHTKVPSRSCRQIGTRSSANRQANTTITTGLPARAHGSFPKVGNRRMVTGHRLLVPRSDHCRDTLAGCCYGDADIVCVAGTSNGASKRIRVFIETDAIGSAGMSNKVQGHHRDVQKRASACKTAACERSAQRARARSPQRVHACTRARV